MKKFLLYFNKYVGPITFVLIIFLFCYFRLKPIFLQTVPYTFDQGRDFIKAQGIIRDFKPVLSGPTTGIPGLNHGVWWYYFLAIPYLIFSGLPTGYPLFIFIASLLQLILFSYFLKKEFGWLPSLMFALLVTGSPYFTMMSFFVINGVLGFPFILLFFYSVYKFFKTEQLNYFFWIFLSIGFIFESELPSGALTLIAFLIILLILKKIKLLFLKKGIKNALLGILVPLTPRILYEVIKGFPQSRTLFDFIFHPEFHTPKPFDAILRDRISLFKDYFSRILPTDQPTFLIYLFFLVAIIGIVILIIKSNKQSSKFFLFSPLMLVLFFILSCFYKDFFWDNYYEGIRYYFILTIVLGINGFLLIKNKIIRLLPWLFFTLLLVLNISVFLKEIKNNQAPMEGLRKRISIVDKMYEVNRDKKDFCVRIYTPPVIPYTYDYLFDYFHDFRQKIRPTTNYTDNQCWYIFESEMNEHFDFRIIQYRKDNIPATGKLIKVVPVHNDVIFELWEYYPNK